MILNDIERAVICGKQEYRTNSDFIEAIESAVIAKLAQGVDMPEAVNNDLADDISAIDAMYRGDPTYEHDAYYMRKAAEKCVRKGYALYTADQLHTCIAAAQSGRDAALARLAEIENQEPAYLLTPDGKCYAYGSAQPLSAGHADATLLELYAAAGASPVEPNFCESCAMDLSTCDCVTPRPVFVNQLPSAQPPAPGEAAREYMTGYSDAKEWAKPSQAVELDYERKLDIVSNWFSDEGMQSRAMQMLGDIEQAIAAAPQPKETK